jgi:LmbE family N-acetylglucosaminyl deacetylase
MRLDRVEKLQLIESVASVVRKTQADTLYIPYRNDAHSDHAAVFDAAVACTKSFRYPSVRSVYTYETLSETEFGLRTDDPGFRPNRLVDISNWLEQKISIMHMFDGEITAFPFPRSETCMRAQAALRGSQASVMAAEAFMVLKEIR